MLMHIANNRVGKLVEPKKQKLRETQEALDIANKALKEKQDALKSVEDRVLSKISLLTTRLRSRFS